MQMKHLSSVDISFRHPTQPIVEAVLHVGSAAALCDSSSSTSLSSHDGLSEQPRDELPVDRRHLDVAAAAGGGGGGAAARAYVGEHRVDTEQQQQCNACALHKLIELSSAAWSGHTAAALGIEFGYVDAELVLIVRRGSGGRGQQTTGPGRQIGLMDEEAADALRQQAKLNPLGTATIHLGWLCIQMETAAAAGGVMRSGGTSRHPSSLSTAAAAATAVH